MFEIGVITSKVSIFKNGLLEHLYYSSVNCSYSRPFDKGIKMLCIVLRVIIGVQPQCTGIFELYYLTTSMNGGK